jgi:hypothetical protein
VGERRHQAFVANASAANAASTPSGAIHRIMNAPANRPTIIPPHTKVT